MRPTDAASVYEFFLQIHVTTRCNLHCTHCYVNGPQHDMSLELFEVVIGQSSELTDRLGARDTVIHLTGGEPLVRDDLDELLAACRGIPVRLLTNGTLIDSDRAAHLAETCHGVQVSFDGTRAIHDARRGAGSFDAAFAGLIALHDAGAFTSARVTVGRDNQHCVEELFDLLSPYLDSFNVSRVVPMDSCSEELPETDSYRKLIHRLYARSLTDSRIALRDPFYGPLIEARCPGSGYTGCAAGISGICVTENGDIVPCRRLPVVLGNVRETTLAEVYFAHPLMLRLRKRELSGHCGECEDRMVCGGSRCIAYALTGDPLASDPGCIFQ